MANPYNIASVFIELAKRGVFKLDARERTPGLQLEFTGKMKYGIDLQHLSMVWISGKRDEPFSN